MSEIAVAEYKDGFQIADDQTADWAVRKIREADEELARMEEWYKNQLDLIRKQHDETVSFFTGKLAQYMTVVPARDTKTTRKYALASGDLVITKEKPDFEAVDNEALLGWCQVNSPDLVRVSMKPAWSDIKKRLKATDSGIVDTDTGMIVEGVELIMKPESFTVKVREG